MSSTFDTVAKIISETCDIPQETIKPESHAIDDLGIDSLDFLDIAFAIDKAFGIKMPLEQWTQEVNGSIFPVEQPLHAHRRACCGQGRLTRWHAPRIFSDDRPHFRSRHCG